MVGLRETFRFIGLVTLTTKRRSRLSRQRVLRIGKAEGRILARQIRQRDVPIADD